MTLRRQSPWRALILTGICAAVAAVPASRVARGESLLTAPPISVEQGAPAQVDPTVLRSRYAVINFDALPARRAETAPAIGLRFPVELFGGESITAVFDHFDPNATGVTWVGTVEGIPLSNVTLVYGAGTMAGNINLPDRVFSIRPARTAAGLLRSGDGAIVHVVAEINQTAFPPEAPPIPVELSAADITRAADTPMGDTADFVDVLVVYTASAAASAGGTGIGNLINLAVSDTNTSYANSGVAQRIRLVGTQQVPYAEVGTFSTNLNNLRNGLQGLQDVAGVRDALGADLVAMLVRPSTSPDACGMAFVMTLVSTAFAPSGYSVTDTNCISNLTFPHELGHNMGLRHDWYVDNGVTPFVYGHGHVDTTARFRTIMSYPDLCASLGITCTRLLAFSNPSLTFNGAPTGVPAGTRSNCALGVFTTPPCDSDERQALNTTAVTVANFRQARPPGPPLIVAQSQGRTLAAGESTTLQIIATGAEPLAFQWYRGISGSTLSPIGGANSSALVVTRGENGVWAEQMNYWVRVSNSLGKADSPSVKIVFAR